MNIITKKVRLVPAPFVGSILNVHVGDELIYKLKSAGLAAGHERAIVNWGDGTVETFDAGLIGVEHHYATSGDYSIRLSDDIVSIGIANSDESSEYNTVYAPMVTGFLSNAKALKTIAAHAFHNATNLRNLDVSESAISGILVSAFKDCHSLQGALRFPCVVNITGNTENMPFDGCENITEICFAAVNKDVLLARPAFANWEQTHLGAANATVSFDL